MAMVTLLEGSIFGGRYRVGRCIADGGMGAVYEVVHVELRFDPREQRPPLSPSLLARPSSYVNRRASSILAPALHSLAPCSSFASRLPSSQSAIDT